MLKFKNIEIKDIEIFKKYLNNTNELSCENTFANLLIWQKAYNNMIAVYNDMLFIKSGKDEEEFFALPFGGNLTEGINLIKEYCGDKEPKFWVSEGGLFDSFLKLYGDEYELTEIRENFDYIYLSKDLAELSGKKYHSKRNHINAFSKKYDWEYLKINSDNISVIKDCFNEWHSQNDFKEDFDMKHEKQGIGLILDNASLFDIKGGAIKVDGKVVAFTFGMPINNRVFNVHIEKALNEYNGAYALINREFVKNELSSYELINREDDLGLEGLRKSKLSYKPFILLKKFVCIKKEKL